MTEDTIEKVKEISSADIKWILNIGHRSGQRVLNFFFDEEKKAKAVFKDLQPGLGTSVLATFDHLFGKAIIDLETFSDIIIMEANAVWMQQMFAMETTYLAQVNCQNKYKSSLAVPAQAGKFIVQ